MPGKMWIIPYINKYSLWFPFCTHNSFSECIYTNVSSPSSNHPMEFKQCDFMLTFIYSTSFDSYKLESNVDSKSTLLYATQTHTHIFPHAFSAWRFFCPSFFLCDLQDCGVICLFVARCRQTNESCHWQKIGMLERSMNQFKFGAWKKMYQYP